MKNKTPKKFFENERLEIGRILKCPKCGSENTTLKEDDRDEWKDLCILCFSCGYDEREIKNI